MAGAWAYVVLRCELGYSGFIVLIEIRSGFGLRVYAWFQGAGSRVQSLILCGSGH